jgi:tetratricopeptide (TPR) repeat protein
MTILKKFSRFFRQTARESTQNSVLHAILAQAKRAENSENYDAALDLYKEAKRIAENNPSEIAIFDILIQWSEAYILKGAYAQAADVLADARRIAEQSSQRVPMAYVLCAEGRLALEQGDLQKAERLYEQARILARQAGAPAPQGRATVALGHLALLNDNANYAIHLLREGIPLLQEAGDTEPLAFAFGRLGSALIVTGQEAQGRQVINTALEHGMERRQIATLRSLSMESGLRCIQTQDFAAGQQHFTNMLKLFPYPERHKHLFVQAHALATYCAFKARHYDDADRLLKSTQSFAFIARESDTTNLVQAVAGLVANHHRQFDVAVEQLQQAVSSTLSITTPELLADIWLALAHAHTELDQIDQAFDVYEKALAAPLAPADQIAVHIARGELIMKQPKRRADAQAAFQTAMHLAEVQQHTEYIARLHALLGRLDGETGSGARATKHLEQALILLNSVQAGTNRMLTLELIADTYVEYGDLETTEGLYRQALEIARNADDRRTASRILGKIGMVSAQSGHGDRAVIELTQARHESRAAHMTLQALRQTNALGTAYRVLGDLNTALAHHYEAIAHLDYTRFAEDMAVFQIHLCHTLIAAEQSIAQTGSHAAHALEYASSSDHQLLLWEAKLLNAQVAVLGRDTEEATSALQDIRDDIQRSHARRLTAYLKQVESQLASVRGDSAAAQQLLEEANYLRRIAQMPELPLMRIPG